ncbi:helix-turn-helix domain-containing protein [Bacillus cereus]|uniref:winged helix-turn-helix transcriptional regulator n=1 Tax=Bacillus cereus TaxID=1396 RepID=UPI000BF8B1C6|nr:helix-turn-helix domain-containing protein [Bacillus cereus]MDA2385105.1 helix-turn-helix domain-containing protein [Bacillus cereus]PEW04379.1 transcriptional regulator [Bacillus cereus]PEX57440.1 transcriptional regulator [Bacillus cereus]PFC45156.1 transcriptional regulator [Bacillus cereus]PFL18525.1 transcriptional regulator [Bacillus cereus]
MQIKSEEALSKCPIEKTMSVIGGKWTFLILRDLFLGPKRFAEIEKSLNGISPRTLSLRLKELEKENIIKREIYSTMPPHVEYSLTKKGETLRPIFEAMKSWGNTWDVLEVK